MNELYAISDLHVDYPENQDWVQQLSKQDYQTATLLVAGDLTHDKTLLRKTLLAFQHRFRHVVFVPGNHDLWVKRNEPQTSLEKFTSLRETLAADGIIQEPKALDGYYIVPLLSWYDFSFGTPERRLRLAWSDFYRCRWPDAWDMPAVTDWFTQQNAPVSPTPEGHRLVTFSHFMPRQDLLPAVAIEHFGFLLPVLGAHVIDEQIRAWGSNLHLYGHSHVNVDKIVDGIRYVNNARGYPSEPRYASRQLIRLEETTRSV